MTTIPRMTEREKAASINGGALDERMPEADLRRRLADGERLLGVEFDADAILRTIAQRIGWYRMMRDVGERELSPAEIRDQARDTAAVADELVTRLHNMHPIVKARAGAMLVRLESDGVSSMSRRLSPDLHRLIASLRAVEADLRKIRVRTGPKRDSERTHAFRETYTAIRKHSKPALGAQPATLLTAELLTIAEPNMPMPTDEKELRAMRRG